MSDPAPPAAHTLDAVVYACALALLVSGCASVPGETLSSGGLKREIRDRVLVSARSANPQCKEPRIINTDVVELHSDGKVAAEIWTVDQCRERINYRVIFPPAGRGKGFSVRRE